MKTGRWSQTRLALLILSCAALTCHPTITVVAVPEGRFRTETTREDRLRVPLNAEDRDRLLRFLRAGGDRQRPSTVIVDPRAEAHYKGLLNLLEDPQLTILQFEATPVFHGLHTDQIIDSRNESPPTNHRPIACTDGAYWWIAYPEGDHITGILVTRSLLEHPEQPGSGAK